MNSRPLSDRSKHPYGWAYDCSLGERRAIGIAPKVFEWFCQFSDQMNQQRKLNCALGFYHPDGRFSYGIQFEGVQPNLLLGLAVQLFWVPKLHTAKVFVKNQDWGQVYEVHTPCFGAVSDWLDTQDCLDRFSIDPNAGLYTASKSLWGFVSNPRPPIAAKSKKRTMTHSRASQGRSKPVSQLEMGV